MMEINTRDNEFLLQHYLDTLRTDSTRNMYEFELKKFIDFLNKPLVEATKWDLSEYNKTLKQKYTSKTTLQRIYTSLRGLFKWMMNMEVIESDPTKGPLPRLTPKSNPNGKVLTREEVEALKRAAFPDARDYALITLLATTGLRLSEVADMDWKDIISDDKDGFLAHVMRKGQEEKYVPLRQDTMKALARYKRVAYDASPNAPIFGRIYKQKYGRMTGNGLRKVVSGIAEKAGIDKEVTPHWFRHTFASQTLNNGAGLGNVQNALNHKNIATTQIYVHMTTNDVADYFPVDFGDLLPDDSHIIEAVFSKTA